MKHFLIWRLMAIVGSLMIILLPTMTVSGHGNHLNPEGTPVPTPTAVVSATQVDGIMKPLDKEAPTRPVPASIRERLSLADVHMTLEAPNLNEIQREDATPSQEKSGRRIGIVRQLPSSASVVAKQSSLGRWVSIKDGSDVWTLTIQSADAQAIRIHVEDIAIPEEAQLIVFNTDDPQEAYGPFDTKAWHGQTDFWMPSVFASKVTLELHLPPNIDTDKVTLKVHEIAHIYIKFAELSSPQVGTCHNDVTCSATWANDATGVAGIGTIGQAGALWCTGALLNDFDSETWVGYFLTANHCVDSQNAANTLEFYWLYQTSICNGVAPDPNAVPRTTSGADLIATQTRVVAMILCFYAFETKFPEGFGFWDGIQQHQEVVQHLQAFTILTVLSNVSVSGD